MPKREPRQKNKGGRPRGSKTVTKMSAGRLMDLFDGCYSAEEWARRFKKLSPESQFKYRAQLEPRAKEERTASTFSLVVEGLFKEPIPAKCPKCSHEFTVTPPTTQQKTPEAPISPPAIPEVVLPGTPKTYIPDEGALKKLADLSAPAGLTGDWYPDLDDFDPEED